MNVFEAIYTLLDTIRQWLTGVGEWVPNLLLDAAADGFEEIVGLGLDVIGAIPVPAALASFTWPEPIQTLSWALYQCHVPEALAILAGAFTIRAALKLTVIFG